LAWCRENDIQKLFDTLQTMDTEWVYKVYVFDDFVNVNNDESYPLKDRTIQGVVNLILKVDAKISKYYAKGSIYESFVNKFENLIKSELKNCHLYATTYGFGLWAEDRDDVETIINAKLQDLGINYKCEYSSARWVFRYRISRAKENINKL